MRSGPVGRGHTARRIAATLAGALTLVVLSGVAVPTASAAPTDTGTRSLQDLGACLAETKSADVLLLVDESGSLKRTDPKDTRVAAAQLLLNRLADTAARSGATIDLAVSGFAAGVRTAADWAPLDKGSVGAATAAVADFAGRDSGFETDYWTALTAAHAQLVAHRDPAEARPCQALVLFTDGQYELSARKNDAQRQQYGTSKPIPGAESVVIDSDAAAQQVVDAGRQDICRSGGVADQLRSDRVLLIALGLSDGGNVDLSLLSSIAESQPSACGAAAPYGLFLAAGDVQDLVLAFDAVGDPSNPPLPVDQHGVCAVNLCPQEAHVFQLDASIRSIHLVGTSSAAGIVAYVQPPGVPAPVLLSYDPAHPSGTAPAGALGLNYNWYADGAFSVDTAIPADGANWSGKWSVVFVDPTGQHPEAVSRTQLTIQADLGAVVDPAASVDWRVAENLGPVPFALLRADGTPAVLGDPAPTLALDVALRTADGKDVVLASGVPAGQLGAVPISIPDGVPPGPAELRTSLAVTTVGGQALQPQVRTQGVTVAPPLGFPTLAHGKVDFGTLQGTQPGATRTVEVTGPGCVWVAEASLKVHPPTVDAVDVLSAHHDAKSCLTVGDGKKGLLDVRLKSPKTDAGDLQGDLLVMTAPTGHLDRAVQVRVAYTAGLERPANTSVLVIAFVLALLVGIGLPILVFLVGRQLAARLPGTPLQSAVLSVRVGPGGLVAAGGGPVQTPERWDLVPPPEQGRRRAVLSGVPVRARAGRNLTAAGYAEVDDASTVGVAGAPGGRSPRTLQARLPLALAGSWTVLVDRSAASSDDADVLARLLLVTDALATSAQRDELVGRARVDAPPAVADLRTAAQAQRPEGQPPGPGSSRPATQDPFAASTGDPFVGSTSGGGSAPDPFAPGRTTGTADPFGRPAQPDDPFRT